MADLKKIQSVVESIDKVWGKNTVMRIDENKTVDIDVISTGSFGLDIALGCWGYPKGRIIEIIGWESSGKSSLAIHGVAEVQKEGLAAAYIDTEHAFDKDYAKSLGVQIDGNNPLFISQPDFGEQALDIAERLINSGEFGIIVIDSVAALIPKAELEGEIGDSKMGLHARLMSQALRKLTGAINKNKCIVIFINQYREKIGIMFGDTKTVTGGNALKFYASVRLEVSSIGQLKDTKSEEIFGKRTRVKVLKNKMAPPFKKAEFDLIFGKGISRMGEVVDLAVEMEIIKKSGSWFSYGESKLGQGRDNAVGILEDNPELAEEIESKIKDKLIGEVEE